MSDLTNAAQAVADAVLISKYADLVTFDHWTGYVITAPDESASVRVWAEGDVVHIRLDQGTKPAGEHRITGVLATRDLIANALDAAVDAELVIR